MKFEWVMSWVMFVAVGITGCAASPPQIASEPAEIEPEPIELHRDGRFIVSEQPDETTLRALADEGITTVVSCRSVKEMEGLDFDQAALLNELGMTYIHVPMGGDHGYEPAQLEAFTEALVSNDDPVYIHCASGGRARYAVMGYLIREQGATVDEAMQTSRRLGAREPILDQLLGETVRYVLDESAPN